MLPSNNEFWNASTGIDVDYLDITANTSKVDITGTQNFCKSATKSDFVRTAAEVSTPVQIAKIFIRQQMASAFHQCFYSLRPEKDHC